MNRRNDFLRLIVGIGASAGGLEALISLFSKVPVNTNVTFVVAQHMARDGHDELVVRLIARESQMEVVLATDGVQLLPDRVYIIPSGMDGRISKNRLHLFEPLGTQISTPSANVLFTSLAEDATTKSIGLVLSGTGSDGTLGCKAIKAMGGTTIAQTLSEAKFNGMPSSAIASNAIDFIMTTDQIADFIFGKVSPKVLTIQTAVSTETTQDELTRICESILRATGINFLDYKEETLLRRLDRRKQNLGIANELDYSRFLERNPEELKVLQQLFLVSVSSFFRDRESFDVLRNELQKTIKKTPEGEILIVWVAGCATGEEAYTLAIMLKEITHQHPIQIYASDLNPIALDVAKQGVYKESSFKEMDKALIQKYFTSKQDGFEVIPEIKALVHFDHCDILECILPDRFSLVSCRNMLIYFKTHLQDQLIKKFSQNLNDEGLLFIGQSESLSLNSSALFTVVDNYHRLFKKRS